MLKREFGLKKYFAIAIVIAVFSLLSASEESTISPDQALSILQSGNKKFIDGKRAFPDLEKSRLKETADKGQHPIATILSCSDSRVPPEHIFDSGIGDIFIVRVAGNVADIDEIGTVEYGVEHLHTPLLVVLGHTSCGAVTAVLKGDKVEGFIPQLIDNIVPAVEKTKKIYKDTGSEAVTYAVKENVWQSISDIISKSSIVKDLLKENKLKIVGAVYHIDDGKIDWMGTHPDQSKLISGTAEGENKGMIGNVKLYIPLITSAILMLLYIIFFYLFISPKNQNNKLSIKKRMIASTVIILSLCLAVIMLNNFFKFEINYSSISLNILLPLVITVIFSIVYSNTLVGIVKTYLKEIRERGQEQ